MLLLLLAVMLLPLLELPLFLLPLLLLLRRPFPLSLLLLLFRLLRSLLLALRLGIRLLRDRHQRRRGAWLRASTNGRLATTILLQFGQFRNEPSRQAFPGNPQSANMSGPPPDVPVQPTKVLQRDRLQSGEVKIRGAVLYLPHELDDLGLATFV